MEFVTRCPASLPVGADISCWTQRHTSTIINKEGNVEWHPH